MSILQELKQRKIFRAAAIYAVVAWGALQFVDVISDPLSLPPWFATVVILLLAVGFPVAMVFSWIFDLGPDGPGRTVTDPRYEIGFRGGIEIALLILLITGIGWLIFGDITHDAGSNFSPAGTPVVMLMDTYAPMGVYDEDTRRKSGTNADVLSDVLNDLPIITQKEAIGSTWDREVQMVRQKPSLVLIHRSAFFHSMNQDLGVGYPLAAEEPSKEFRRLYEIADNKLVALLGFLAAGNAQTRFLVYSRGTGGGWTDEQYRQAWISEAVGRFPRLADRITAMPVPGGTEQGSFLRPDAAELVRARVASLLGIEVNSDG